MFRPRRSGVVAVSARRLRPVADAVYHQFSRSPQLKQVPLSVEQAERLIGNFASSGQNASCEVSRGMLILG